MEPREALLRGRSKRLGPSSFSTGVSAHMEAGQRLKRSNTGIRSKLSFLFDHFDRGGWIKWTKQTHIFQSKRWVPFSSRQRKNHLENAPHPFVEPCIVSDPNLPGASPPSEASEVGEPYDGQLSPAVRRGLSCYSVPPWFRGGPFHSILLYTLSEKNVF